MILGSTEIFSHFLKDSKVLVVDRTKPSRRRIIKSLKAMDFHDDQILESDSLANAEKLICYHEPQVIISDFKIKGGNGLEVFSFYKDSIGNESKCSFILISSQTDQTLVSKAAEHNIDGFLLKPYSKRDFSYSLQSSIETKVFKGKFYDYLEEGIDLFEKYKLDEARLKLNMALEENVDSALVQNYFGQIYIFEEKYSEAKKEFEKGLAINSVHHHCLLGLLEVYMTTEKYNKAYEISKKIVKYYPGNQNRMAETIRLAIKLGKFNELEDFYNVFVSSGKKGFKLSKYICSGLLVAGKYFLIEGEIDKTIHFYNELTSIYQGDVKFIRAMIENLTEHGHYNQAKNYLKFFPFFEKESNDYKIADFLTNHSQINPALSVSKGNALLKEGIRNFHINKILIQHSLDLGMVEMAKELVNISKKDWPNRKRELDFMLLDKKEARLKVA